MQETNIRTRERACQAGKGDKQKSSNNVAYTEYALGCRDASEESESVDEDDELSMGEEDEEEEGEGDEEEEQDELQEEDC